METTKVGIESKSVYDYCFDLSCETLLVMPVDAVASTQ